MPKRDPDLLLEDARSALARIERYIAGLDRAQFLADEKTIGAVVRNLEIIGEAVRWLPTEFRQEHPTIPWDRSQDCEIGSSTITLGSIWKSSGKCCRRPCATSNSRWILSISEACPHELRLPFTSPS